MLFHLSLYITSYRQFRIRKFQYSGLFIVYFLTEKLKMAFYCFSHVPSELPNGLVFLTFHQNTVNLTRDFKGPQLKQRLLTKEKIIHSVYFISSPSGSIFIISRLLTSNNFNLQKKTSFTLKPFNNQVIVLKPYYLFNIIPPHLPKEAERTLDFGSRFNYLP